MFADIGENICVQNYAGKSMSFYSATLKQDNLWNAFENVDNHIFSCPCFSFVSYEYSQNLVDIHVY